VTLTGVDFIRRFLDHVLDYARRGHFKDERQVGRLASLARRCGGVDPAGPIGYG
jgi:hypothetical protein